MAVLSPAAEELKSLIVEAGLELLDDVGLSFDLETVSYANVFRELKRTHGITVTGSSVHGRIWPSQEHFRLDVVAELYRQDATHRLDSLEQIMAIFDTLPSNIDPDERTREFFRLLGNHLSARAGLWRGVQMVLLFAAARRSGDSEATKQFQELNIHQANGERVLWAARYQEMAHRLNLAPKAEINETLPKIMDLFVTTAARVMCGFVLDEGKSNEYGGDALLLRSPGTTEAKPWTILGLVFYSVTMALFEQSVPGGRPAVPAANKADLFEPSRERQDCVFQSTDSKRRTREELRSLLVQTGVDLINQQGIELTLSSLTYRAVFDQIKRTQGFTVNRSSVHKRFWENHDSFRLEVLAEAASRARFYTEVTATDQALAPILDSDGNVDQRRSLMAAIEKQAADRNLFEGRTGSYYRTLLLKCALMGFRNDSDVRVSELAERLQRTNSRHTLMLQRAVRTHVLAYGLRENRHLGIDIDQVSLLTAVAGRVVKSGSDLQQSLGPRGQSSSTVACIDRNGSTQFPALDDFVINSVMSQLLEFDD